LYAVLRFRADHPEMRSPQMAEELAARLGRPCTPAGVRQALHRAREKFADLLLDEVTHSLEDPTAEHLEQELVDLGLLDYCRPALERHGLQV
jgi:RNA polymerase sigma-70 factor (ECF subfamily)